MSERDSESPGTTAAEESAPALPVEVVLELESPEEAMQLFGPGDRNLKRIRESFPVQLTGRGSNVRVSGDRRAVDRVADLLRDMISRHRNGAGIPRDYVDKQVEEYAGLGAGPGEAPPACADPGTSDPGAAHPDGVAADGDAFGEGEDAAAVKGASAGRVPAVSEGSPGGTVFGESALGAGGASGEPLAPVAPPPDAPPPAARPPNLGGEPSGGESPSPAVDEATVRKIARSPGQAAYLRALLSRELVFCIGPAGTGKTFLAVNMAIHLLRQDRVRRIVLCRPAVEAGEKLGFLPGDFQAKINPYLRPLYDALNDTLDYDQVKRYLEREVIEVLPLAYMRGRTLNSSFIILDEGQNTSVSQMKMFLTRMGMNSRIVVNGDITQVDLPAGQLSGLIHAQRILRGVPGTAWIELEKADIVRHPLVKRIVAAYEVAESANGEGSP